MSEVMRYLLKMEECSHGDYIFYSTYKTKVDELEKIIKNQAAEIQSLRTEMKNREWSDAVEAWDNRRVRDDGF